MSWSVPENVPGVITVVPLQSVHVPLSQSDLLSLGQAEAEREGEVLPVLARPAVREGRHQDGLDVFRQWDRGRGEGGGGEDGSS